MFWCVNFDEVFCKKLSKIQLCYLLLTIPMWRAVEDFAGYGPTLLAVSRHIQMLLGCFSIIFFIYFVQILLPWSPSASSAIYSACHHQILRAIHSHYVAQESYLPPPYNCHQFSHASNCFQNAHITPPPRPANLQHSPPAPHLHWLHPVFHLSAHSPCLAPVE